MPLLSWVSDKRCRITFRFTYLLTIIFTNCLFSSFAQADDIELRGKFNYILSDTKITDKNTNIETSSELSFFNQQYNFNLSKTIYPYLTFLGGVLYEIEDSTFTGDVSETELKETLLRPFV